MRRLVCIHGHFYQPPRENPWLEEVESQESAYPYHDWNARITSECYAPNTASRVITKENKIKNVINNYEKISFNFGPTLLSWLQSHNNEVYQAIIDADKASLKNFSGHGSSLAQCYNHMIMPLANKKDKRTQVIWGIKDFELRFNRKPEGMWLPETAVDIETLEIFVEFGISFTVLVQSQVRRFRKIGEEYWHEVKDSKIDPKRPYVCNLPSGNSIVIFLYDGPIANDIAFGGLLHDGENFAKRMLSAFVSDYPENQLVNVATDGETYGHHYRFADTALANCLHYIETQKDTELTVYGEFLEKNFPDHEIEIHENSSWSCSHGIERWRSDCGCSSSNRSWSQAWRAPLRRALDWLRDNLCQVYEEQISSFINDPWKARDEYIEVILDRSQGNIEKFLSKSASKELTKEEKIKLLKLFEMQRYSMLMYTSCGWFFDEISGLETVQILQYAERAMQLAKETSGKSFSENFSGLLEKAPSNIEEFENGSNVYRYLVKPAEIDLLRVGINYAILSLFRDFDAESRFYCYSLQPQVYNLKNIEGKKIVTGIVKVRSDITWDESEVSFAVQYYGNYNLICDAQENMTAEKFYLMKEMTEKKFLSNIEGNNFNNISALSGKETYSLRHLFRDLQAEVLNKFIEKELNGNNTSFKQQFENNIKIINEAEKFDISLPCSFLPAAEFVFNMIIRDSLIKEDVDIKYLKTCIDTIKQFSLSFDKNMISYFASNKIFMLMKKFYNTVDDQALLDNIKDFLEVINQLPLELDLWKTENLYFFTGKKYLPFKREQAEKNIHEAKIWIDSFCKLGECLEVGF